MRIVAGIVLASALCPAGPAAAQSFGVASFFAAVDAQGTTLQGSGIQASKRAARGQYIVVFTRPVTSCAFATSVRSKTGGHASVSGPGGNDQRVVVKTFSSAGAVANRAFDVIAFCAP